MTGDLLSAFGLLVAAVTALYSLWVPSLEALLSVQVGLTEGQKGKYRAEARKALAQRSLPLALAAVTMVVLLAAPLVEISADAIDIWLTGRLFESEYDPVAAMFVVVYFICCVLALTTVALCVRIFCKMRRV